MGSNLEARRLFDIFACHSLTHQRPDALAAKTNGKWRTYSTSEVAEIADGLTLGLHSLGIKRGDRVAIIASNRPEWIFADLAILQLGAVVVPIYPTATPADYSYILKHSGARVVFVGDSAILDRFEAVRGELGQIEQIYSFSELVGVMHWSQLLELGDLRSQQKELQGLKAAVQGEDLATVIYTSGTTGTPKGVMLTHANIVASVAAVAERVPTRGLNRALSFLPLSHILERSSLYFYQHAGLGVYFAESLETLGQNLREVRPQVLVAVPRLLEKFYEGFTASAQRYSGKRAELFAWALTFGASYEPDRPLTQVTKLHLNMARNHVFRHWRQMFGGDLKLATVGGSALNLQLGRSYWAAGICVYEGYGLTENSPVITSNSPYRYRLGTVGVPMPGVEVRINPEPDFRPGEGEILARGPTVMRGYYLDEAATEEAIDAEGWLHTGDIGLFDKDGFLQITDRKKEMFKTSGGKYIAPLAIESKFKESPVIAQMLVVGENRKFPAALIVPEFKTLAAWCEQHGLDVSSPTEMTSHERVLAMYEHEVSRLNRHFGQWEQIKEFRLMAREWSVDTGELTPKMSMRRRVILAQHRDLIDGIYKV